MLSDLFIENMIGQEIGDFTVTAYKDGEFFEVSKDDLKGKWSVFFFYPEVFEKGANRWDIKNKGGKE